MENKSALGGVIHLLLNLTANLQVHALLMLEFLEP